MVNSHYIQKAKESNPLKFNNKIIDVIEKCTYILFVSFPDQLIPLLKENLESYGQFTYWCLKPDLTHPLQQRYTYLSLHDWKAQIKEFYLPGGLEERFIIITNAPFVIGAFGDPQITEEGAVLSFYNDYKYVQRSIKDIGNGSPEDLYRSGIFKTTPHQLHYYVE